MKVLKTIVGDALHQQVKDYADANNRSVQRLIVHALRRYMRDNPVEEETEITKE